MKIIERKLQEISGSLLATMPRGWINSLGLKKGSKIRFAINSNGTITIFPGSVKEEEKKETVIHYDEHFVRRFFREYLSGYEKIIFKCSHKISPEEKKSLYLFLKKFMNVQIIEEQEKKVVIKCFKIEELSIRDCLKRMYFLTLNMLDELKKENDKIKMLEIKETVQKFYYMLVMQIRRFIGEGKYTETNQIGLLRAMDCRMVGEKVERIARRLIDMPTIKSRKVKEMLEETTFFYKKSFSSFINNSFEKAVTMRLEEEQLEKKYAALLIKSEKNKNIDDYKQINDLLFILKYSRNISMLIR